MNNPETDKQQRHSRLEKIEALGRVNDTLERLRRECPWDRKQTNESLRPNTIEETFELAEALLANDSTTIRKELGDVLLHILFYSLIGEEKGDFDIADVADSLNAKLIFRHPHVFGDVSVGSAHDVEQNWEQIKLREKGGNKTILGGVPSALPAMIKADRIQEKAANSGFDWEKPEDVWKKVDEEIAEFRAEAAGGCRERMEAEMGDVLFSIINASRLYGINPENALEKTNRKFISRFNHVERRAAESGRNLRDMTLAEMDQLWDEAKSMEGETK
ncbi:MAG: nucleoside triphosphate pyrophosphohydrolase [Paramuribaculum sp.]|nr:nucleoside triphosphate pyrophosphohydrolase [Paramuribaculum sp.]